MARTSTKPDLPGGITQAQRDELLAAIQAERPDVDTPTAAELTPRDLVVASLLKERDHLEGCPGARVEAYEERAIAPGPATRNIATAGDVVVVVRCITCAGVRYRRSPLDRSVALGANRHVDAVIAQALKDVEPEELDGTL